MIKNASIRVGIKVKPAAGGKSIVTVSPQGKEVAVALPGDEVQRVQVDMIHDANSSPNPIYTDCCIHQLVGRFVEGYNVTVLTYGQTGSGKTFAFEGDANTPGIISQAVADIFANRTADSHLKCSFIQLYNERIADMLGAEPQNERGLRMRWEVEREFVIEDLSERECNSAEEMMREWNVGNRNRVVASNKIHDYSSRSHSIFMVTMEDADEEGNWRSRQAYFVDLAGSERVFSPVGRLSKEAIEINKSLFFLRKVVVALEEMSTQRKEQYIPYRDSKLTSILKRAFGGNCLTYLIACVNPHPDYLEETLATLQYALSAGRIRNSVNVNIDLKAREIRELREEKEKLRKELELALIQIENFKSIEREEELKRATNHEYANRIIECIGTVRELLKSNKELRAELDREKADKRRIALDLQEMDKNLKLAKRAGTLSPINEVAEAKPRMGDTRTKFATPKQNKERLHTEGPSPEVLMSERPAYSQSVELLQRKERGNSIIRRRKFLLHERSEQNAARR